MQTLKEILQREQERHNLKNLGICAGVVILLTALAFGLLGLNPGSGGWAEEEERSVSVQNGP